MHVLTQQQEIGRFGVGQRGRSAVRQKFNFNGKFLRDRCERGGSQFRQEYADVFHARTCQRAYLSIEQVEPGDTTSYQRLSVGAMGKEQHGLAH